MLISYKNKINSEEYSGFTERQIVQLNYGRLILHDSYLLTIFLIRHRMFSKYVPIFEQRLYYDVPNAI